MQSLYSLNSNTPYPLMYTGNEVPLDILLDIFISSSAPKVMLSDIDITAEYVFMSFISRLDDTLVGYIKISKAIPLNTYTITMMDGGYGHLVLGYGILRPFRANGLNIEIEPSTCLQQIVTDTYLNINGEQFPVPSILNIEASGLLQLTTDEDDISVGVNPTSIAPNGLYAMVTPVMDKAAMIYSINDIYPDTDGNIKLTLTSNVEGTGQSIVPIVDSGVNIGLKVILVGISGCPAYVPATLIKCRTDLGISSQLPLDFVNCPDNMICKHEDIGEPDSSSGGLVMDCTTGVIASMLVHTAPLDPFHPEVAPAVPTWNLAAWSTEGIAAPGSTWQLKVQTYDVVLYTGSVNKNGKLVGLPPIYYEKFEDPTTIELWIICKNSPVKAVNPMAVDAPRIPWGMPLADYATAMDHVASALAFSKTGELGDCIAELNTALTTLDDDNIINTIKSIIRVLSRDDTITAEQMDAIRAVWVNINTLAGGTDNG